MIKFILASINGTILQLQESELKEKLAEFAGTNNFIWVHIYNPTLQDIDSIKSGFDINFLELENLKGKINPKVEQYPTYLYIVIRSFSYHKHKLWSRRIDFFLGVNFLISISTKKLEFVDYLSERYLQNPLIFMRGPDFVLYEIFAHNLRHNFKSVELIDDHLDLLETEIFHNPNQKLLEKLFNLKKDILCVKRIITPTRELFLTLTMEDMPFIKDQNRIYFQKLYDRTVNIASTVDLLRDVTSTLLDSYTTVVSNKLNEIMKVLTIIATIFMPLTFIAGVYGMNFSNIPEMHSPWGEKYGYFFALGLMLFVAIVMLVYFKRKQWI